MVNVLRKGNLGKCIFALVLFASVFVFAGDVVVKEGVIEGVKFKTTYSTASGAQAVAFGAQTTASGANSTALGFNTEASQNCSTAMGYLTTASGNYSTAMGKSTTASGDSSNAMGVSTTASGAYSIAMGRNTEASATSSSAIGVFCKNNISSSFTVGYGGPGPGNDKVDFRVRSELVNVYGGLEVDDDLNVKGTYKANGTAGWSGWFDDGANFRVIVTNGIITAVGDSVSGGHNP